MADKPCTVIIHYDKAQPPQVAELKKSLENGQLEEKMDALKQVILLMMNGENLNSLLMTIIRFVMPIDDKTIKKLLLLYWEITDKTSADGKLLHEMILVCNALRNDLNHPNEYVRGATLRFLSKLKEAEILEPLLPSIRVNLEYKHAYVRRNGVLALYNVYKNFDHLCPDAPELIYHFLLNEGDAACKRNAFIMLFNCAQDKAVEYLGEVLDQVAGMGDILQLIIVELIKRVFKTNPGDRAKYIKCIFTLLSSTSSAVQYEAAGTLVTLSSAPTAVKAAAHTFVDLLVKESDNNVKMIVLDRLASIKLHHSKILQEMLMDVLRALASPNMEIREKALAMAMDLVSPKNIEEVILVLKKEIQKTQSKELEKAGEYRQILIQAIHTCTMRFPDVAGSVVHILMDFLGDATGGSAADVITFVREVVEMYPDLRPSIITKLLETLNQIKSSKVFRSSLWIIGEYSNTPDEIDAVFTAIREVLGPLPLVTEEQEEEEKQRQEAAAKAKESKPVVSSRPVLNADGTYATQSALISNDTSTPKTEFVPNLRVLLLAGDYFLGTVLAATLVKLVRKSHHLDIDPVTRNMISAEVLLIMTSILRLGQSHIPPNLIDADSQERIIVCIKTILEPSPFTEAIFLKDCRSAFTRLCQEQQRSKPVQKKKKEVNVQADDLIKVRQLSGKKNFGSDEYDDMGDDSDLSKLTSAEEKNEDHKLNRVYQLTGFSDPLYAEAYVVVHQYDILLDIFVLNQTPETLQNLSLELATLGDLKLVERPQNYTLAPHSSRMIKANIKVSSTDTGIIFGNLVYDIAGVSTNDKNCVILNDIHIDIMDYITPATCTELKFRTMWAEFEWENKVAVNTNITDVNEYLAHILKSTNMNCLAPESALSGDCDFLSANLYAKSVFGEDALANLSVEKQPDGKIGGYVRIRSKTQGIALSLGDKITLKQRVQAPGS
eukprot:TRINITY_DN2151_c0_g1_i1.p1 TRINITY_DN2151_c0_g1~~TRINITY_DN2151_c0_g1_i1.p1  ORF type:complete len:947 (+),score=306.48 TRINITY_DN2151_c0_g1_i1:94-2934(+)